MIDFEPETVESLLPGLTEPPGETISLVRGPRAPRVIQVGQAPGAGEIEALRLRRITVNQVTPPEGSFVPGQVIGRGGNGEVWSAWQVSLRRTVALKRQQRAARPDSNADAEDFSFYQEAFVTASLEHPNIVPVYDLGQDEAGRPALAMKLVKGEPWSRVMARDLAEYSAADVIARHLPILVQVAQAVAFSHERGVVHRDLKPSQVMIGQFGEVQLMDWGLAVSIREPEWEEGHRAGADETGAPTLREAASPAGTPLYMAPEQTHPTAREVGTWTDVYLLGGILYQILTGKAPHQAETSYQAMVLARQGIVPEPHEAAPGRDIPQELAAIAMQALEPSPSDRISSAQEFIRLIDEFQGGVSRRREAVKILESIRVGTEQSPASYQALTHSLNQVYRAQLLWPEYREAEDARLRLLEAKARLALKSGDLLLAEVVIVELNDGPVRENLQRDVAIARRQREQRTFERSVLRWTAAVLMALLVGSGAWFISTLTRQKQVIALERDVARRARAEAEELITFALRDLTGKAAQMDRLDVLDDVLAKVSSLLEARESRTLDVSERKNVIVLLKEVAGVRHRQGRLAESKLAAARALNEGLDLLQSEPNDRELKKIMVGVWILNGELLAREVDRVPDNTLEEAFKLSRELVARDPNDLEAVGMLASCYNRSSGFFMDRRDFAGARAAFEEQLRLARQIADARPTDFNAVAGLGIAYNCIAATYAAEGRLDEAWDYYNKSLDVAESLFRIDPQNPESQGSMYVALDRIGGILAAQKRYAQALEVYGRSKAILMESSQADPEHTGKRSDLAIADRQIGDVLRQQGMYTQAKEYFQASIDRLIELHKASPADIGLIENLALGYSSLGGVLAEEGRHDDARQAYEESLRVGDLLGGSNDHNMRWTLRVATTWENLGDVFRDSGYPEKAEEAYETSLAIVTREAESLPKDERLNRRAARQWGKFAEFLQGLGRTDEAAAARTRAAAFPVPEGR